MKKENFILFVYTENKIGLLNRLTMIFTRRHLNIDSLTVSESEIKNIHRFTIVVKINSAKVKNLVRQIEKQVDMIKAFYYKNDEVIHQEIALYKMPFSSLKSDLHLIKLIRSSKSRILTVDKDYFIIEKAGLKEETEDLFNKLSPFGIMEFVRSGVIAVSKSMKKVSDFK